MPDKNNVQNGVVYRDKDSDGDVYIKVARVDKTSDPITEKTFSIEHYDNNPTNIYAKHSIVEDGKTVAVDTILVSGDEVTITVDEPGKTQYSTIHSHGIATAVEILAMNALKGTLTKEEVTQLDNARKVLTGSARDGNITDVEMQQLHKAFLSAEKEVSKGR